VLPTGVGFTGCYSPDITRTPFVIGTSPGTLCIPVHQTISAFPVLDKVSRRSLDVKVTHPPRVVRFALVPKRKQIALRPHHDASISRQCAPGSPGPLQLIGKEPQRALHGVFRRNGIGLIALTLGARIVEAM